MPPNLQSSASKDPARGRCLHLSQATSLSVQGHAEVSSICCAGFMKGSVRMQDGAIGAQQATVDSPAPLPQAVGPSGAEANAGSEQPREETPDFSPMQISPALPSAARSGSAPAATAQRRRPVSAAAGGTRARFGPPGPAAGSPPSGLGSPRFMGPAAGEARRTASGGAVQGLESVAALELLGDCAAAEAAAARRARGVDSLLVGAPLLWALVRVLIMHQACIGAGWMGSSLGTWHPTLASVGPMVQAHTSAAQL